MIKLSKWEEKTQIFLTEEFQTINVGGMRETENHWQNSTVIAAVGKFH